MPITLFLLERAITMTIDNLRSARHKQTRLPGDEWETSPRPAVAQNTSQRSALLGTPSPLLRSPTL